MDTTLFYERTGQGPAILFIHGMCGHADVWADQAARFADRFTCVRYDRRGHCRSDRGRAPVSTAQHADDAAALIETLDLAPCLAVGSSSGAVIAIDLAPRNPGLASGRGAERTATVQPRPRGGPRLFGGADARSSSGAVTEGGLRGRGGRLHVHRLR